MLLAIHFFTPSIFIALYLGLVVGEKHVYRKNGLSTRPLHLVINSFLLLYRKASTKHLLEYS